MARAAGETAFEEPVPLTAIFIAMLAVSLCGAGAGGGLIWARRIGVERRRWLTEHEFADIVSLCQFLPGPNIVGIAVCIGARLRGAVGAVAALAGFLLIPWTVGLGLGVVLLRHAHLAAVGRVLGGFSAAGAGLLIAAAIRILKPHLDRPAAPLFSVLALVLIIVVKLPLLFVVLALVPLSIAAAGFEIARAR
jgi:chromate transporter